MKWCSPPLSLLLLVEAGLVAAAAAPVAAVADLPRDVVRTTQQREESAARLTAQAQGRTYLQVGSDPLAFNGGERRSWELPAPATYVITPDRKIVLGQVDGDYRRRTEPADIIQALRQSVRTAEV
ncbi:hypothetical protein [Streptomyces sp. NBC_01244]|uniref:hypothetical protein n=1 Tax=Streptomyces sp. NBC_01244 TaxID=2903797 RepID=UPI002E11E61F|nr:hypothetical protein OG247_34320 [Streptomyces sp. NBC_01244]